MFESVATGQFSFVSESEFAFGTEFSVMGHGVDCIQIVSTDLSRIEVRVQSGEPLTKRYVVVSRKPNGNNVALYEALPVDCVLEEAQNIERDVVARLQAI